MKEALRETDEFIAKQKQAIAENTDFERGFVQLPSPAFLAAVNNRERIAEVVSELEKGASLRDVSKKLHIIAQDVKAWETRARKTGY